LIYLDTSVVLAQVLAEDVRPPEAVWEGPLVSSRLTEYESWTRVHARGLGESHGESLQGTLARVSFLELAHEVVARALDPFPIAVRTLDALHLASVEYLRGQRVEVELATYDERMRGAAEALGIALVAL